MIEIDTERLRLREMEDETHPSSQAFCRALTAAFRNEDFYYAEFTSGLMGAARDAEIAPFIRKHAAPRYDEKRVSYGVTIASRNGEEYIGFAEIYNVAEDKDGRTGGVGIFIMPDHQRCGYAQEAMAGLFDWAFKSLRLDRLWITVDPDNTASMNLFTSHFPLIDHGLIDNPYRMADNKPYRRLFDLMKEDWRNWRQ